MQGAAQARGRRTPRVGARPAVLHHAARVEVEAAAKARAGRRATAGVSPRSATPIRHAAPATRLTRRAAATLDHPATTIGVESALPAVAGTAQWSADDRLAPGPRRNRAAPPSRTTSAADAAITTGATVEGPARAIAGQTTLEPELGAGRGSSPRVPAQPRSAERLASAGATVEEPAGAVAGGAAGEAHLRAREAGRRAERALPPAAPLVGGALAAVPRTAIWEVEVTALHPCGLARHRDTAPPRGQALPRRREVVPLRTRALAMVEHAPWLGLGGQRGAEPVNGQPAVGRTGIRGAGPATIARGPGVGGDGAVLAAVHQGRLDWAHARLVHGRCEDQEHHRRCALAHVEGLPARSFQCVAGRGRIRLAVGRGLFPHEEPREQDHGPVPARVIAATTEACFVRPP